MCTIAGAKVQLNYNCYNVYFYECLLNTCTQSNAYMECTFFLFVILVAVGSLFDGYMNEAQRQNP